MPNMVVIIFSHNKALLAQRNEPDTTVPPCNCRAEASCPIKDYATKSLSFKSHPNIRWHCQELLWLS